MGSPCAWVSPTPSGMVKESFEAYPSPNSAVRTCERPLVLVGLPELHGRLRLGVHRSLLTRIGTWVTLEASSPELTVGYVRQRMEVAGARQEVFTADGLSLLHELSGGVLRSVDVLASSALRLAATEDKRLVDRDVVRRGASGTPLY